MSDRTFVELVRAMRRAQREYFKTRSRVVLDEACELEKQVDAAISNDTPSLFPSPEGGDA